MKLPNPLTLIADMLAGKDDGAVEPWPDTSNPHPWPGDEDES